MPKSSEGNDVKDVVIRKDVTQVCDDKKYIKALFSNWKLY